MTDKARALAVRDHEIFYEGFVLGDFPWLPHSYPAVVGAGFAVGVIIGGILWVIDRIRDGYITTLRIGTARLKRCGEQIRRMSRFASRGP